MICGFTWYRVATPPLNSSKSNIFRNFLLKSPQFFPQIPISKDYHFTILKHLFVSLLSKDYNCFLLDKNQFNFAIVRDLLLKYSQFYLEKYLLKNYLKISKVLKSPQFLLQNNSDNPVTVSYTHLTLPTICSV